MGQVAYINSNLAQAIFVYIILDYPLSLNDDSSLRPVEKKSL